MFRGFDPASVRAALRPLDLVTPCSASAAEASYFSCYGIDFENHMSGVVHRFGSLAANGYSIACHFYEHRQARGTCVLLHGYFDHTGLYGHLIEYCLQHGYSVLIWDLPGHGLSNGEQADIHDFRDYTEVLAMVLDQLCDSLPTPLLAIGQSTGGAILMNWVFRSNATPSQSPFERIALLAPLVRPARWRSVRALHTAVKPFRRAVRRKFMDNSSDRGFLDFVRLDPLQSMALPVHWVSAMREWVREFLTRPVTDLAPLVVQGTRDETVDWRWNLKVIREKFPRADVHMLDGARHHLVNETPALRAVVFEALGLGVRDADAGEDMHETAGAGAPRAGCSG